MARPARLGRQQPDVPPIGQRRQRVDERIDEVPVLVPPPQQDDVNHVVIVLADKLHAVHIADRVAQILVAIVVVADLLHHLARLDAEPLGLAALILGLARLPRSLTSSCTLPAPSLPPGRTMPHGSVPWSGTWRR